MLRMGLRQAHHPLAIRAGSPGLSGRALSDVRAAHEPIRDGARRTPTTRIGPQMPVIAAMWHGQHFMIHFAKRPQDKAASLVSRSGDGEFNAVALRHLGIRAIRGSGARGRDIRKKGGVAALRGMLRALADGEMVVMTADIPKIVASMRRRHRDAGANVGTADRSGCGRHQPPDRFQQLGPREPRPPLRSRARSFLGIRSTFREMPTKRRSNSLAPAGGAGARRGS